ncbi:MAG: sulfite reductase subunit alpha [Verrucomicrobiota bacterium]
MNIVPETAPFSREQRAWLNGFFAASLFDRWGQAPGGEPVVGRDASPEPGPLWIGYGSQSGGAAALAKKLATIAEAKGYGVTVRELNQTSSETLVAQSRLVVVTSTWGDGEAPDNAAEFLSRISDPAFPRLESLRYSVLGLGDRNYADFCGAARRIDERLAALGARCVLGRVECDGADRAPVAPWMESLWAALSADVGLQTVTVPGAKGPEQGGSLPSPPPVPETADGRWSRRNPYPARLKAARCLNGEGSAKDTRHIEIDLGESGLAYEAGDALGVQPVNDPTLVAEVLEALAMPAEAPLGSTGSDTLHEALLHRWVLTQPSPALLKRLAERAPDSIVSELSAPSRRADLDAWVRGRDVVDALRAAPGARLEIMELGELLRPLQPRLYSIASSPKAHPGEVHLTVGTVRYEAHGRRRQGVASCWLADRVIPGETPVPVFVQVSRHFRPPADPARPMIMVGPGTGIAPFRAFLQERRAIGATGRHWLFFGDQRRATDFLYADELEPLHQDGFLTRLDLAFSRDQEAKVYVQDRMREQASELWRWLEDGAHFYICGDAQRMAKDVEAALLEVIRKVGGRTEDQALEYLDRLQAEGRYGKDVY